MPDIPKKNIWYILDVLFAIICISGVFYVALQNYFQSEQDFIIIPMCLLPYMINKIVMSLVNKEASIQGVPYIAKRSDEPSLFWLIIAVFTLFLIFCIMALAFLWY